MSDFAIGGQKWPGISKLVEETGEATEQLAETLALKALGRVQQVAGKLLGTGGEMAHWDGSDLKVRLEDELADAFAAFNFVIISNGLDHERINDRMQAKLILFDTWHANEIEPLPDAVD
jgi:NTP pyrophosphatase (non-canonical NTP hydrolase)